MTAIQRISIEIEARRLIARARKVNRAAAKARGGRHRKPLLCLHCRIRQFTSHPAYTAAGIIALAIDMWGLHKFGAF